MKPKSSVLMLLALFALASVAHADDDTMMVVAEGATPDDIAKIITLPVLASPNTSKHVTSGRETANKAKTPGKEFGQQIAEDARNKNPTEHVRDDMRQNARREAREEKARGRGPR